MFARAVLAFLALPGLIAFAVPVGWLVARSHTDLVQPLGVAPLLIGTVGLLWCVRDFYVSGNGTLAPWAPPVDLVVVGLYRYTRNPMYVSVTLNTVIVALAFHLRVILGEEPWLARTHGLRWREYASHVPRWFI